MAAYGCDVSPFTGTVERTYSGQDLFDISSYLTESIPEFSFPTTVTQTQIISAGLASGTASSSGGSSSNSYSNSNDDDEGHKISIGAIVGGVIGGIGALALLGGFIIFLLWKKRRDKRNAASAAAFHQHQQQQQQHQQAPMPGPGFGAPHGPNDYKPPPMGPPPPQQQYGAPSPPPQMQQPGNNNNMSFYTPPPPADTKHTYTQHSVSSSVPSTPGPYSPPLSPSPLYSPPAAAASPPPPPPQQQHHPDVPQIDGTPVHKNAEGDRVHEAP